MSKRHHKLGIKQTIQRQWMDKTVQMMLAGLSEKEIRAELDEYLSTQKQSGGVGKRGKKTYGMAISILSSWFGPDPELVPFRDDALALAGKLQPAEWLPLHWAVISASYPFWFNVAFQTGRLLNLQEQVTQRQIFGRLKERYGDREVVARNARYVVRSFIAWRTLAETDSKGCYAITKPMDITDMQVVGLLLESMLLATPSAKGAVHGLIHNPACFPFRLPIMNGKQIALCNDRVEVARQGLDEELLQLA